MKDNHEAILQAIGKKISEARKNKGISQTQLLEKLRDNGDNSSVCRTTLSALENGKTQSLRIHLNTLYAIGQILDVDINHFLGEQEQPNIISSDISGYLGLSEKAIDTLRKSFLNPVEGGKTRLCFLNDLITSEHLFGLAFTYEQYVIAKKAYDSRKENYEKELTRCQEYNEDRISHLEEWYEEEFEDTAFENRPDKEDWIAKNKEYLLHQVPSKVSFYAESRSAIRVTEREFLDQITRFLDEMGEKGLE